MSRAGLLLLAVAVLAVLAVSVDAKRPLVKRVAKDDRFPMSVTPKSSYPQTMLANVGKKAPWCSVCINVAVEIINVVLNEILNGGVVGGCGDVCGKIPNKLAANLCDLACVVVGIEEFIKIIEHTDIDPIFYCEEVHLCPIVDCKGECLKINSFAAVPSSAALGAKINATAIFTVYNETGTGMTRVDLYGPNDATQQDVLDVGFDPGSYSLTIELDTSKDVSDDDMVGPQPFEPGTYTIQLWFCEGECGSKHPHSKIYDVKNATFTLH